VAYVIEFRDTGAMRKPGEEPTPATTTALQHMKEFVAVVMAMGGHGLEALKECHLDWGFQTIAYEAQDVKWYEGYKDVDAHHKLMQDAEELHDAAWIFNAVGEDDEHETRTDDAGGGWDMTEGCRVYVGLEMTYKTEPVGDALRIPDEPQPETKPD
jgi:hypothetical protein